MKVLRYIVGLIITGVVFFIAYACVFASCAALGVIAPSMKIMVRFVLMMIGAMTVFVLIYHAAVGEK